MGVNIGITELNEQRRENIINNQQKMGSAIGNSIFFSCFRKFDCIYIDTVTFILREKHIISD